MDQLIFPSVDWGKKGWKLEKKHGPTPALHPEGSWPQQSPLCGWRRRDGAIYPPGFNHDGNFPFKSFCFSHLLMRSGVICLVIQISFFGGARWGFVLFFGSPKGPKTFTIRVGFLYPNHV
ncbi:MAG: hypothetical protein CM15mP125_0970 [Gammaproteobacteria bacterium]|nr:MAG: hypothetical protein CM15mP125_0970 [Gammaproteobacteria bacterium]